jgi:hypothetical protein
VEARHQWLMAVILAILEAEIRRIEVRKFVRPYPKKLLQKRASGMAKGVDPKFKLQYHKKKKKKISAGEQC